MQAGAQPFCRCNHVRVVFSPPYVTPCARVGLLLSDAPHRRGAVPASRTAARGRPPELYSRPLIGEMIGPRLIERMFSPQGVSPRFARPFPTAMALRPSQVKAFARRRSSAGWPPVCRTPSLRSPPAATCADWQPSPPPTSSPPLRVPFGYSEGPGTRTWTAVARASLLPEACRLVGIDRHIVVAHSWGVLVALALALDHPRWLTTSSASPASYRRRGEQRSIVRHSGCMAMLRAAAWNSVRWLAYGPSHRPRAGRARHRRRR